MSASVLYMSTSVDGYIAGPNDEPDNRGGSRLFEVLRSRVEMEIVRRVDTQVATQIHYRVRREDSQSAPARRS